MLSFHSMRDNLPKGFSYWILPLISGIVWFTTLITMMIYYYAIGSPHLPSMEANQNIPYVSDIGASTLKPLFITGSTIATLTISLTLVLERFLRHRGRLAFNLTMIEKILAGLSIGFAGVGTLGLILLTVFDTWRYPSIHFAFLMLFLGGFIFSSVCSCWEYQRLGMNFREFRQLRASFWLKLVFIILEVSLSVAFGVTMNLRIRNTAAIVEWTLAFGFGFYIFSFIPDLLPAIETKPVVVLKTMEDDIEKQDGIRVELPFASRLVVPRPVVLKSG